MEQRLNELSQDEKVLEWRVQNLERQVTEIKSKLDSIEVIILRLDSKFPAGGLLCPLHQERMNSFDKRIEVVEAEVKQIGKKIVAWSAGAAVILFLLTNLVFPYVTDHYKIAPSSQITAVHSHSPTNSVP